MAYKRITKEDWEDLKNEVLNKVNPKKVKLDCKNCMQPFLAYKVCESWRKFCSKECKNKFYE